MIEQTIVNLSDVNIYQQENQVLQNVNLNISKGEFVYLIGKTGSGKSSLLKTLYAALPLRSGKGIVSGFDLKKLNRRTIPMLRRKLGIVFQDFNLLDDRSIEENLNFALRAMGWKDKAKMSARINELLERVDLKGKNNKMPYAISGGEQQRVVIARALLNHPELIIADEPTGNLDPETSDEVLLLLRKLAQENDTAVLFATHDYRILENFPARIVRCHNGKVFDEEDVVV
ncbi:MAG: ATP-binding cassette domain-containing protein [Saprospiraceae bacterium]|nr:ATP-binding cassette domain-containing protein [Saprospiraceae bacterium]MCF8248438.1 ATP-binding cassette domain-containing protein [Saprospiraceae bacterium]MCF8281328.1 ATP-binding cassette domain-containing protein [Bacteroidales bacterium]MCF8309966.1 ATP-binding cassette domain-containing protein [Saprospiraceae bacterium]MCF8438703.1 ATP-binding cassette domain-containing protein [Saprospiraceae bacterium]